MSEYVKGDFQATCVRPYQRELIAFARKLTRGDEDVANDVVQDSLIKAWRSWEKGGFTPKDPTNPEPYIRGWLFRIVANTFAKHWRRKTLERRVLGTTSSRAENSTWTGDDKYSPLREVADNVHGESQDLRNIVGQVGDEVLAAASRLYSGHWEVVLRHCLHGEDHHEITAAIGIPKGTVNSRIARAREKLIPALAEYAAREYRIGPLAGRRGARVHADGLEPTEAPETEADSIDGVVAQDDSAALCVG